ncbi:MAG: hypothetical protein MI867_13545 [Pseudomonadales bacterium]|nr:hypothetical protein [Pseudomonadales bacterium]
MADNKNDEDKSNVKGGALTCAFCGKSEHEVKKMLVIGPNKKPICNECVVTCQQILKDTL